MQEQAATAGAHAAALQRHYTAAQRSLEDKVCVRAHVVPPLCAVDLSRASNRTGPLAVAPAAFPGCTAVGGACTEAPCLRLSSTVEQHPQHNNTQRLFHVVAGRAGRSGAPPGAGSLYTGACRCAAHQGGTAAAAACCHRRCHRARSGQRCRQPDAERSTTTSWRPVAAPERGEAARKRRELAAAACRRHGHGCCSAHHEECTHSRRSAADIRWAAWRGAPSPPATVQHQAGA